MHGDPFGLLGVVLDEKFRVDAIVGEGQLSIIYKGHHLGLDSPVAITCLQLPETLDPALTRPVVEAFEDAGRLHDRLGRGNPHVAQTIAAGQAKAPRTGATVPYRVREWFEGESLASDLARRRRAGEKPRTLEEAVALLAPAIEGIAHAHEEGIAHLSLDPSNLFLARDDGGSHSLRVLDFGTARGKRAEARPTLDTEVTRGLHLLHPSYAAPEQLDMNLGEPGAPSDVYALALILMEILAERADIERHDTAAFVKRALDKQKRPTPQNRGLRLPRAVDHVLTRAVTLRPVGRQKNARVFLNELQTAMGQGAAAKAPVVRAAAWSAPATATPSKPSKQSKPSKPAKPPPPPMAAEPAPALAIVGAPVVLVAPAPPAPLESSPQPEPPPPPTPQPEPSPLLPSVAASGPVAAAPLADEPRPAPIALAPSVFHLAAPTAPLLLAEEEPLVPRRLSPRARQRLRVGAAALAFACVVAALFAFARRHRHEAVTATRPPVASPSVEKAVPAPTVAPLASPPAAPKAATPAVAVAHAAPAIAVPPAVTAVSPAPPPPDPHPSTHARTVRFSPTAAQHAISSVSKRIAQCRRGNLWGSGYATVAFGNDGAIHRVLVDPPFSMNVAGKCVADALRTAHVPSFAGRVGYYRLHFYIAQH